MAYIELRRGKYNAQVRRVGHKSISKSFDTKKAAEAWARKIEHEMDQKSFKDVRDLTDVSLTQLINRYIEEITPTKPMGRTKNDSLKLWKLLHGSTALSDLTESMLIGYVKKRAMTVEGVTIAVELSYLRGVLKTAKELWRLPVDPGVVTAARASMKYIGLNPKSKERDRRPTQKEIDDLCLHFEVNLRQKVPMHDIILFAIETTMRSGEITRLRWEDLDEEKKTIIIRDRKHPTEKIGNDQLVPLLGTSFDLIMKQKSRKKPNETRIFPWADGTTSSRFPRACKELGIIDLRFHDLRHEGISRLFEQGYQIQEVAIMSGHKDWKQLRRYTNLRPADLHQGPISSRIKPQ